MNQVSHGYGLLCLLVTAAPIAAQQPGNTGPVRLAAAAEGPAAATTPAAEESSDNVETVTVTGIRAAIESAIAIKQDSNSIVEAISAEDIGKLPDTSIAESISRLPGLTSQRADGRASDISVRGTDPEFATALLNGREQVSTGDNRNIEFDQYPSELMSGVVIYKTPDASLVGQGLSGTIAMQTTRPLEYGHRTIVLNVRGEKNSDANLGSDSTNHGYRASFSYIDQFFDNTLGLTLGYARLDSPIVGKELGMYDPWKTNGDAKGNLEHATLPANVWISDGIKSLASSGDNRRDGALATLEWKPNASLTSAVDVFYTKNTLDNDRRSVETNLGNYPGVNVFTNPVYAGDTLVGATVSGLVPLARNFSYLTKDQILQAGWNNKWVAEDWSVMGDVAYSRATRDEHDYETQGQYQDGTKDTATFYLPESSQPSFRLQNPYNNPAQVLVGPTIYGAGYSRFPHVIDELKSFRLEGSHAIGHWFSDVVVGVNYDDRKKDKRQPETSLSTIGNLSYQVPANLLLPEANLGFSGTPASLAWNVPGVLAQFFQPIVPTTNAGYLVGKTWKVFEKLTTVYVKGDLDQQLTDSVRLRGNIGVQVVHTDQSSTSTLFNEATNTPAPVRDGKSFNDVLPAANLVFELPAEQAVRLGLAKEVARARMDELASSFDFGVDQTTGKPSSTVGNAKLDPWRATAVDLSYEKYFAKKAYVSASVFYKDLKTYIYKQTVDGVDYSRLTSLLPPDYAKVPVSPTGFQTIPLNGQGGRLDGIELTASAPGELLSHWLSGFGAILSVSQTDSSIHIQGQAAGANSQNITLPGLSKTVWNATVYFEKYGFSARVATRYRSNYIGEITDFSGSRALEYVRHEQITDLQTSYEFQHAPLQGLSILFQINNLTNTPFIDYAQDTRRIRDYETFGRDFFFGLNYKL
jgi:iron complex outermembrane recepter protein